MLARIWNLAVKEYLQLVRDRLMTGFLLIFPVAQLMLLAQATGHGIHSLPLAITDYDRTAQSRGLERALDNTPELVWMQQPESADALAQLIEAGAAGAGIVIPPGFGRALASGEALPSIQVIVDGSNTVTAGTAQAAIEGVISDYLRRVAAERGIDASPPLQLASEIRYNPGLNSRLFTIPAQLGFIVFQVTLAVASLAFARERELGTLEQLLVTPLRRIELISGKAVLAWLVGGLDFLLMYFTVVNVFHIPMRGSFALLFACSLLFIGVVIGFGVIVSSFARNQQQAILYVFLLAMLSVALSGYLVPVRNMPALLAAISQAFPLQHFLVIIRSIMLKGAGWAEIWPEVRALLAIGGVVGTLAVTTATRRLE